MNEVQHEGPSIGDTVATRNEGDSRNAFELDFYNDIGIMVGYRNATTGRPLIAVTWLDGKQTEAVETTLRVVERSPMALTPIEAWEKLRAIRERRDAGTE